MYTYVVAEGEKKNNKEQPSFAISLFLSFHPSLSLYLYPTFPQSK